MLRSEWGRFSAEYGFGDAWGGTGGTSDDVAGGGGGGSMSSEVARGLADYEGRLQTMRDANAAREAINRGDTERAAAILAGNPEIGIETQGVRLRGEAAANYLVEQATRPLSTATSTHEAGHSRTAHQSGREVVQPPDLSNRGVPQLTQPHALPSGQIPLDVVSTSSALPPPPPPPLSSSAGQHVAARQGVDRAAQLRSQLTGQAANPTSTTRATSEDSSSTSAPPLPPLSAESLREFNGGSIIVPVHATDTPQTVARRQLEMMVAAVGQNRRLEAEDQRAFVEEWSQRGLGLSNYEAGGTRRAWTAEEFRAAQTEGSTFLQLRADWQPEIVAELRRLLELSEPVRVETNAPRMTREEQRVAGRHEAEQQMVDFYRLQANAGINLIGGLLNTGLGVVGATGGGGGVAGLAAASQAGVEIVRLPNFELQSEYFRGARGEVLQTAADIGAGVIAGGVAGGARAGVPSITAEAQAGRQAGIFRSDADPIRARYGSARASHPQEFNRTIEELRQAGVDIDFRPGALGYSPRQGEPGRFIFDPEGSIGALRHERRHFIDNRDMGYPGLSPFMTDNPLMWRLEYRGYMEEVNFLRSQRDFGTARQILQTMRDRRAEILGGQQ